MVVELSRVVDDTRVVDSAYVEEEGCGIVGEGTFSIDGARVVYGAPVVD
jgi:hypothetical protein